MSSDEEAEEPVGLQLAPLTVRVERCSSVRPSNKHADVLPALRPPRQLFSSRTDERGRQVAPVSIAEGQTADAISRETADAVSRALISRKHIPKALSMLKIERKKCGVNQQLGCGILIQLLESKMAAHQTALFADEAVQRELRYWWDSIRGSQSRITREQYISVYLLTARMLQEASAVQLPHTETPAKQHYTEHSTMDETQFCRGIFDVLEPWADDQDAADFAEFIELLRTELTRQLKLKQVTPLLF
jgi:hypothetical protein